jgi:nitrite reductase (NADH) small subunit
LGPQVRNLSSFEVGEEGVVAAWVVVCREEEVPEGGVKGVEVEGLRIALYRDSGTIHALFGHCPHAGGPIDLGWIEDGEAVCPLHRWRFRLTTGRCTTVAGQSVHRFACEVREGQVWVAV